jgi:hypothetical protein
MCEDNKLKLIPVVIIVAALVSALLFSFVNFAVFIPAFTVYPYSLGSSLFIILTTAVFAFICGLRRHSDEHCGDCFESSCGAIACFGPVVLFAAAGSFIISALGAAGLDFSTVPVFGAILNMIFGIIAAVFFSATIVYFIGMILAMIRRHN